MKSISTKTAFVALLILLNSCDKKPNSQKELSKLTYMEKLDLLNYKQKENNWRLKCEKSTMDEENKVINCKKAEIITLENKEKTAVIKGEKGVFNLKDKQSFLQNNVKIESFKDDIVLFCEKIYFDSEKNIIWSNEKVRVLNKKMETIAGGFRAKPDLSNIQFFKHETKKN